jgi:hypothetical protein
MVEMIFSRRRTLEAQHRNSLHSAVSYKFSDDRFALHEEITLFSSTTLSATNTEVKNTLPTPSGRVTNS